MNKFSFTFVLACFLVWVMSSAGGQTVTTSAKPIHVSVEEAQQHLLKHPDAAYPPDAALTRIQGAVEVELTIDERGSVKSKERSGHPMLILAATQAANRWKYKPFERDGKPIVVTTEVTFWIPGKPGIKDQEDVFQSRYVPAERDGMAALRKGDFQIARDRLVSALAVAEDRGDSKWPAIATTSAELGALEFEQKNYPQAEEFYQESLALYEKHGKSDEPQSATVMESLANLYTAQDAGDKAEPLLLRAIDIYKKQMPDASTEEFKQLYGHHLAMSSFWLVAIGISSHHLEMAQLHCKDVLENAHWLPKAQGDYVSKGCNEVMSRPK
jgi:TonB family protein